MHAADLLPLVHHPAAPAPQRLRVQGAARREADALRFTFRLAGELAAISVPAPGPTIMADGLWQHTCFEAFVGGAETEAYHELNFAPSGAWAAYAFRAYRARVSDVALLRPPDVTIARTADALVLEATVALASLVPVVHGRPVAPSRLGLTAVIEDASGRHSYWACRHAPGPPDFHHPDVRTVLLEGPHGPCEGTSS